MKPFNRFDLIGLAVSFSLTAINLFIYSQSGRSDFLIKSGFTGLWFLFSLVRPPARFADTSARAVVIATLHTTLLTLFLGYGQVLALRTGWALVTIGSLFCALSWLSIGRAFGILPALRNLRTRGSYRLIRHPIYLSYLITATGSILLSFQPFNCAWYVSVIAMTVLRIALEERLLSEKSPEFRAYKERVRYKLIPWLY